MDATGWSTLWNNTILLTQKHYTGSSSAPMSPCDHAGNVGLGWVTKTATCTSIYHPGPVYSSARPASRRPPLTATSGDRLRSCCPTSSPPSTTHLCTPCPPRFLLLFPAFLPVFTRSAPVEEDPEQSSLTQPNLDTSHPGRVRRRSASTSRDTPSRPLQLCVPGPNAARSSVKLMKGGERGVYALVDLNQSEERFEIFRGALAEAVRATGRGY